MTTTNSEALGMWILHMAIFLTVVGGFIKVIRLIRNGNGKEKP